MQWVLPVVIVAALLYLSRYFPKVAFSVLGLLVLGAGLIVFSTTDDTYVQLPLENIVVENPVMTLAYGGGYRLSARLVNRDEKFVLKNTIVSVTMLDCPGKNDEGCEVIGQEDERIIVRIPPSQSRDISHTFNFGSAKPVNDVRWQFKITETKT